MATDATVGSQRSVVAVQTGESAGRAWDDLREPFLKYGQSVDDNLFEGRVLRAGGPSA